MRIISLNIWVGKLIDPLMAFLAREAPTTDIFCFQEMSSSLENSPEHPDVFARIARALPGFQGFFEGTQEENDVEVGLATFIRKNETVDKEGDFFVYRTRNAMIGKDWRTWGRNAQFLEFPVGGKEYALVNFHGLADGEGREDSDARIEQSHKFKALLKALKGTKIVCGDFNLTRDTKSLAIIDEGMKNLIKESGVTSTRSSHFPYPDKFCDYILVDPEVKVKKFEVLFEEVSDHLPLILEVET
jgi:endonuclease/exonuclease/phosphatase family metal-dependent hydrolase